MTRGTTPTHIFSIPFDASEVKEAMIIYAQNDVEVFRKETDDCVLDGRDIKVTLTQEDTLLLSSKYNVQIQLRILTDDGKALASSVKIVGVDQCLNDEVLQ